ncbi:MAG: LptE family protein [Phycisphaerales bacterium]
MIRLTWYGRIVLLGAMLGGGCASDPTEGYATASPFPRGISTVSVQIFENNTFDREIEFELADALIKQIEARTPYKVTSPARADTILTGRVRSIQRDQLSKSRLTGLSEEVVLSVTIDFQWRDQRTGRPLVQRESFSGHALFVPSRPTSEQIELGEFAVIQRLARDIVTEMQADW